MNSQMKNDNKNKPLIIRAMRGEKTERIPLWFMRQAGRYLPEYHEVRKNFDFMDMCRNVEASVRVSLQPFERFEVDGIIMFSDILTPLSGAGVDLHFEEKRGPVIETTVHSKKDIDILSGFDPNKDTAFVSDILKSLRSHIDALPPEKRPGLLGFAGAPFTLASYLVEGGSTKQFEKTKSLIFSDPGLYHALAERLVEITVDYLKMQADSGADAVQIFESWGGILSPSDYREFAMPHTARIISELKKQIDIPIILFVGNSAHLIDSMVDQDPSVISMDWRISSDLANEKIPGAIAVQGNMDPLVLYGNPTTVKQRTKQTLDAFSGRDGGYVFNLGHGIHPKTPVENVEAMVETVKSFRR